MNLKTIFSERRCTLSSISRVAFLTFGDGKNNPLDLETTRSLLAAIQILRTETLRGEIDTVILEGHGDRNFCTGIDLFELNETFKLVLNSGAKIEVLVEHIQQWATLFDSIFKLKKSSTIISLTKGRLLGAGLTIASLADFSFVTGRNFFANSDGQVIQSDVIAGMPEVRFGLEYPCISMPYLLSLVGLRGMLEYLENNYQHFGLGTPTSFREACLHGEQIPQAGFIRCYLRDIEAANSLGELVVQNAIEGKNLSKLLQSHIYEPTSKKSVYGVAPIRKQALSTEIKTELLSLPKPGDDNVIEVTSSNFAQQLLKRPHHLGNLCKKLRTRQSNVR